jgi:hypothetical protein
VARHFLNSVPNEQKLTEDVTMAVKLKPVILLVAALGLLAFLILMPGSKYVRKCVPCLELAC